jgi:hypothetical protein
LSRDQLHRALRELGLVAALFVAYKAGRLLSADHVAQAMRNAWDVWDFERLLDLPSEVAVQRALLPTARAANCYYAYVHFPSTALALIWLYVRRPAHYLWVRRTLAFLTAAALALHVLMPLAPPRMLAATGMLDTARLYGPSVYGAPESDTLANQYAAMPSLHVGWALVIGLALIAVTRSRWRWLWLAHPAVTLTVVIETGNHYWLDGIVAAALIMVIVLVMRPWMTQAGTPLCPPSPRNEFAETARIGVPSPRGRERNRLGPQHHGAQGSEEAADARRARCGGSASRG